MKEDYIDQYSAKVTHNAAGKPHSITIKSKAEKRLHANLDGETAVITSLTPIEGEDVVYGEDVRLQLEVLQNLDCVDGWEFEGDYE